MKTYIVYIYGNFDELNVVKAETPRQALNLVINEWLQTDGLAQVLSTYRIVENSDTTIRYVNNENEAKTLTFTIAGNKDIETVISELHDNEVYNLENT